MTTLFDRIENRTAVIGIVGLGYVGLPLAVVFSQAGFRVKGIDVDSDKVAMLNRQESYIEDVDSASLAGLPHAIAAMAADRSGSLSEVHAQKLV